MYGQLNYKIKNFQNFTIYIICEYLKEEPID